MQQSIRIVCIFFFLGMLVINVQPVSADESVTLKMSRDWGTDLGNGEIQGKFTIKGTGTANIILLKLYFNQTEVCNATSNSLTFRFNTKDYTLGHWNISLDGFTASDERYTTSIIMEFISEEIGTYIAVGVGAFVLAILTRRIIRLFKNRKAKKKGSVDIKKEVKIEIDKDFA